MKSSLIWDQIFGICLCVHWKKTACYYLLMVLIRGKEMPTKSTLNFIIFEYEWKTRLYVDLKRESLSFNLFNDSKLKIITFFTIYAVLIVSDLKFKQLNRYSDNGKTNSV